MTPPATHALLIRASVHVARDVRPAQAVRLNQRGELRAVNNTFFSQSAVSSVEERLAVDIVARLF